MHRPITRALGALLFPLAALIATSCTIDYESALVLDERPEDVPQTILTEARMTIQRQDQREFRVEAARVESYPELEEQRFWGFVFEEYDLEGELVTSGRADYAVYDDATDDVDLEGNINFRSAPEGITVAAQALSWKDDTRTLSAGEDLMIRVDREDGSWIEGRGFSADFRRSVVEFRGAVVGEIVTEEPEESDG
ncbi:MAG: LPS export ABC transporter periplasmic protein LptC [Spirochaetota bacterium]